MKKLAILLVGILCLTMMSGCTETEQGAGIGAVSGGVIGGVIGNQSGRAAEGAAIGIVGGALLGGLIGSQSEKNKSQSAPRAIATCPNGHQVDVTGFPAGSDVRCPICNAVFRI